MTARSPIRQLWWRLIAWLHHLDFAFVLPWMGKLPLPLGFKLARLRGWISGLSGRDWRSMALGFRHIQRQSERAYRALLPQASDHSIAIFRRQRFMAEAMDEYEARLIAEHRVSELQCQFFPSDASDVCANRKRGLLLLTPHFASFTLGMAFLARGGTKTFAMSSEVTNSPQVDSAVRAHFFQKYRGLERYFNGGEVLDIERGLRPFYRALAASEVVMVLADAPVLPNGAGIDVPFLGAVRSLAGGALRIAEYTNSDIGAFVCESTGSGRYHLRMSVVGEASDPRAIARAYEFLSSAIENRPGSWWASDLFLAMPQAAHSPPTSETHSPELLVDSTSLRNANGPVAFDAVLVATSPLADTAELTYGIRHLRHTLSTSVTNWHDGTIAPRTLLRQLASQRPPETLILVLTQPELITTSDLARQLHAGLLAAQADCAVCAEAHTQGGRWMPDYITRSDFEAYVLQRSAHLPAVETALPSDCLVYLMRLDAALEIADECDSWQALPSALGARTVQAPRAFVHSYRDYQKSNRSDMLPLLPSSVQRVLDIGGGEGGFAALVATRREIEVWLAEPNTVAASAAEKQQGVQVLAVGYEDLNPASHGQFDAVCLLDVLEHLPDPEAALGHIAKLVSPGGYVLISTPNLGHWSIVQDLAGGRFDYMPVGTLCNTHRFFFTQCSLDAALRAQGFTPVSWSNKTTPLPPDDLTFIQRAIELGRKWDIGNLQTESLRVLAQLD